MKRLAALVLLGCASTALAQSPPPIIYPAGQYTITTPGPTTIAWTANSVTLSWGPTPIPPVPPVPPVPPAPVVPMTVIPSGQHAWGLVIYDDTPGTTPLSATQLAAKSSTTLVNSGLLQDVDIQWKPKSAYPSSKVTGVPSWLDKVPSGGYPALLFVSLGPDGKTGSLAAGNEMPLPDTEAEILALVQKVRGK